MAKQLGTFYSEYVYPYYPVRYQIDVESEPTTTPGRTKITCKVSRIGRTGYSPSFFTAGLQLSITATKGTMLSGADIQILDKDNHAAIISGTTVKSDKIVSFQDVEWYTDSRILEHDSNGNGAITVSITYFNIGGYEEPVFYSSQSFSNIDNNMPYTACKAPTSISIKRGSQIASIVKPGETITVSWSGAAGGHQNAIDGYTIYWRITSDGSAPTTSTTGSTTLKTTSGSGSKNITIPSDSTRKHKIVFGIITNSSIRSNLDSSMKTSSAVLINSLPGKPTVSVNKTIVPSTDGTMVTFTVTPGSDANSGQTKKVYFSTSSGGTRTGIAASSLTVEITKTITYYFWTYDGLEFSSSYDSITIQKNEKPNFNIKITGTVLDSINKISNYEYIISPTVKLTNITGGQSDKIYHYRLEYSSSTSASVVEASNISSTSATSISIKDVRVYTTPRHESDGLFYRFRVVCNDGIEETVKFSNWKYITKKPSLIGVFNKNDFTNISELSDGNFALYFSDFLGFRLQQDAGYTQMKIKKGQDTSSGFSITTNINGSDGAWTDSTRKKTDSEYFSFEIIAGSSSYETVIAKRNITRIAEFSIDNLQSGLANFKYYTDSEGKYIGSFRHNLGLTDFKSEEMKKFGVVPNNNSPLHFISSFVQSQGRRGEVNISQYDGTNSDTLFFNVTINNLINGINKIFTDWSQRNTSYSATFEVALTNAFGETTSLSNNFTIDFIEAPELTAWKIYPQGYNDANGTYIIDKWQYLKEGMGTLLGDFTIKCYNQNPSVKIQIKRSTENQWIDLVNITLSSSSTPSAPGAPATYTIEGQAIQTISQILTKNYTVDYQIVLSSRANQPSTKSLYTGIPVRGHTPPVFSLINTSFEEGTATVKYKIVDFGAETEKLVYVNNQISLYKQGNNNAYKTITGYFGTEEYELNFTNFNFNDQESVYITLGMTTELSTYLKDENNTTAYFTTTKSTNLQNAPYMVMYNLVPTIAYRKNHLGINVFDPNEDNAILVIGENDDRYKLYYQGSNHTYCEVTGFCLDGGTW